MKNTMKHKLTTLLYIVGIATLTTSLIPNASFAETRSETGFVRYVIQDNHKTHISMADSNGEFVSYFSVKPNALDSKQLNTINAAAEAKNALITITVKVVDNVLHWLDVKSVSSNEAPSKETTTAEVL